MSGKGRVIFVTGGGHGIGRAICELFAQDGERVVVADRNSATAHEVAQRIGIETGSETLPVAVDVCDAAAVTSAVQSTVDRFGQIDVLVNNAGIYPNSPLLDLDEAEWDAVFDTNVKGMFLVTQAVARQMIARGAGGRIVNLSSGSAESGRPGAAHYCSSKAAVNMLTRVSALELAPHGIVVNAVSPGLIEVPDWSNSAAYIDALVAATPMRRMGQPEEVARAVAYLASPAATYITGTVLNVNGGSLAGRAVPLSG